MTQNAIENDIRNLIGQKLFPCVAAVQSLAKKDFVIETGEEFGSGKSRESVRSAILKFLTEWKSRRSTTYTLFIAYPTSVTQSEVEFEEKMWAELSSLTSVEEAEQDWAEGWSKDPEDRRFSLCLGGHAFFVVGLHPQSSRKGRVFPYPTLIFNVFDQFEDLEAEGAYLPMVKKNRERDLKFQGTANPMVEKYGDAWESIQYSGRENSDAWKCPFHFKKQAELAP